MPCAASTSCWSAYIAAAAFSPDGNWIAIVGSKTVEMIECATWKLRAVAGLAAYGVQDCIAWSPDSRRFTHSGKRLLAVVDAATAKSIANAKSTSAVTATAMLDAKTVIGLLLAERRLRRGDQP